jgi:hypothetical protein
VRIGIGEAMPLASVVSARDPDGDAVARYRFWSNADPGMGGVWLDGTLLPTHSWVEVAAADVGRLQVGGGTQASTAVVFLAASDGESWSHAARIEVQSVADALAADGADDLFAFSTSSESELSLEIAGFQPTNEELDLANGGDATTIALNVDDDLVSPLGVQSSDPEHLFALS